MGYGVRGMGYGTRKMVKSCAIYNELYFEMNTSMVETFSPRRRFAVLINRWDIPGGMGGGYSRLDRLPRGNRHVFEMECALRRGTLDLTREIAHTLTRSGFAEEAEKAAEIDAQARELKDRSGWDGFPQIDGLFSTNAERAAASQALAVHMTFDSNAARPSPALHYDELRKVFPDSADLRGEVLEILAFYRSLADEHSLTLLFIDSHGQPGEVTDFKYCELLDQMDPIPGKKVIINLSCYSGSLVEVVEERASAPHYAVIASTDAKSLGSNWNNDTILEDLARFISRGSPLRNFRPREYNDSNCIQTTTVHIPFNVVL